MTAISLPAAPLPLLSGVSLIDFGVMQEPPNGAMPRYYQRNGLRHALQFTMPNMPPSCGRAWLAAVAKSRQTATPVRMAFTQPGDLVTVGTAPLVKGAGQTGNTLAIDGCTPGVTIEAGRAFSYEVSSRSYLFFTVADVTANGSGEASVQIDGLLMRAVPADNAPLAFAAPVIEGFIEGGSWSTDGYGYMAFTDFTVREVA
jgi:hypothetical protein